MGEEKNKRVLIVEDEAMLQELYVETLQRSGHTVEVAENGRLGFRKGVTFDYDVIVCDLHMPEWNGVDAIKSILLVKPQCKFIVVSAYADRKIADELRQINNVINLFAKPVDMQAVTTSIASA
ncbi:hypothetical protein DESC_480042 [Desulfosarcina cetonica]|uniref:response regulator n=1 Tax=Desulfosarcina cetonica TaxID=90730 RepID=UPI0006D0F90E|nr:response regulator [Desulfosarcina cetonica]VTR66332.1 hypothetical protein DESC_480042 [Desulfosarcina cetonica]